MDVVGRWSFLLVVMTTALNVRSSTSGGESGMKRLLVRRNDSDVSRHLIEARSGRRVTVLSQPNLLNTVTILKVQFIPHANPDEMILKTRLDKTLQEGVAQDCPVSWQKLSSTRSLGGRKMPDTNSVARCLQRCSADEECHGVDVDLRQEPVIRCWEHSHSYDFDKHRTYRVSGFKQYVKEDGC